MHIKEVFDIITWVIMMNYCIYGSESYEIKNKIDEIVQKVLRPEERDSISHYDASQKGFNINEVLEDAQTLSFLTATKIIIIHNSIFLTGQMTLNESDIKSLIQYLENPNPSAILIFHGNFEAMDSRKKLVKTLQKNVRTIICNRKSSQEFASYVNQQCKRMNLDISKDAIQELIARQDGSMENFHNTLDKLSLYRERIEKSDIERLVSRPLEEDIFILVNAVVNRNLKKAMSAAEDLLSNNKNDQVMFIAILAKQFRFLFQVKLLSKRGMNENRIAQILSANPYRVQKSLDSIYRVSLEQIEENLLHLAKLDQKIKQGKMDKKIGFELFLIEATR